MRIALHSTALLAIAALCEGCPGRRPPAAGPSDVRTMICPAGNQLARGVNTRFTSAGFTRSLILVVPASHDPTREWPVVFVWHPLGGNAAAMLADTGFEALAERDGVIVVAPESRRITASEWELFNPDGNNNPDVTFFDEMLACLDQQFDIDRDRVYSTGMSGGGLWSVYIGMVRGDAHAATAPSSGGLFVPWIPPVSRPPSVVTWGGSSDACCTVDFHGESVEVIANMRSNEQFVVECNHGTGHTWAPGTGEYVWQFFLDHRRGVRPEPYAGGLPAVFPRHCRIAP